MTRIEHNQYFPLKKSALRRWPERDDIHDATYWMIRSDGPRLITPSLDEMQYVAARDPTGQVTIAGYWQKPNGD